MKIKIFLFTILFILIPLNFVEASEVLNDTNNDYKTFVEIILSSGKMLKNFTDEEMDEYLKPTREGVHFYEVVINPVNKEVKGTYISSTLFSVENKSKTDVRYEVSIMVETSNTVSFSASGSVSASAGGNINKIKAEAAAKSSVEYSNKTTKSVKEKKQMDLIVEANSRAIIYLMGDITVTNGVLSLYGFFFKLCEGGYEFVTLNSQYARLEKDVIWKD